MENFYTLLSNTGINAIISARASNSEVKLTKIAVGDGDIIPSQDMTALKSEKHRFNINSIIQDIDNPNYLIIEGVIPSNIGGFYVSEVAIYTDQNILFAIGSLPKTYKPLLEEGSAKDLTIKIFLEVTNADSVTLKVDDSVVLSTRKFVLSELKKYAFINGDETKKFKVATPEGDYDAVNKKYVDENAKLNINSFPEKITLANTDNLAIQETGGLLKKVSFENLKKHIAGQVIQSSTVNNMVTTAINTDVDWNDLQATITPKSIASKILITVTFGVGDSNPNGGVYLKRNSTKIGGTGITASCSHPDNIWNMDESRSNVYNLNPVSIKYLDSPTSTNSLTYKIGARLVGGTDATFYLNRPRGNADYGNFRATITLEEIL